MRTDKQLLQLAAKAMGYEWRWQTNPGGDESLVVVFKYDEKGAATVYGPWNPLLNDAEVFGIIVKLKPTFKWSHAVWVHCAKPYPHEGDMGVHEVLERGAEFNDLRRLIVRLAAEYGALL